MCTVPVVGMVESGVIHDVTILKKREHTRVCVCREGLSREWVTEERICRNRAILGIWSLNLLLL